MTRFSLLFKLAFTEGASVDKPLPQLVALFARLLQSLLRSQVNVSAKVTEKILIYWALRHALPQILEVDNLLALLAHLLRLGDLGNERRKDLLVL